MHPRQRKQCLLLASAFCTICCLLWFYSKDDNMERRIMAIQQVEQSEVGANLDNSASFIFIGGIPRQDIGLKEGKLKFRSGTTLMRAMLDAHPDVRW